MLGDWPSIEQFCSVLLIMLRKTQPGWCVEPYQPLPCEKALWDLFLLISRVGLLLWMCSEASFFVRTWKYGHTTRTVAGVL